MKRRIYLGCLMCLFFGESLFVFSQGKTNIYLIKMTGGGQKTGFSSPVKINERSGYNNQPSFLPDGSGICYASSDGKQTDIFYYDIKDGKNMPWTDTPESEYSPLAMPSGKEFSVIQLILTEGERKGAQPLMAFPLRGGRARLLCEEGKKIGYHAWIDDDRVAVFVLGEPNTLQVVNLRTKESKVLAENIGRSLYARPLKDGLSVCFVQEGFIKSIRLSDNKIENLAPLAKGNDFFCPAPDGSLMMAANAELFRFRPGMDKDWTKIGDFSSRGINNITRMAIDLKGTWLAVVAQQLE